MEAFVTSQTDRGIGTITFYHPQSNSMPGIQLQSLVAEIEKLGNDDAVKVIVLKSEGDKTFCAGASFDELISIKDLKAGKEFFSGFAGVINAMRKVPKFIIASIQGKAVGGGVGIAAAADYALATESAAVKLSELTIGIGPFVIEPVVKRKIGLAAFMELSINAKEWQTAGWAKSKGLYAETFETIAELDEAVDKIAVSLSGYNPDAMKHLKKTSWEGTDDWDTVLANKAAISGELVLSDFTVNAIGHFKTK